MQKNMLLVLSLIGIIALSSCSDKQNSKYENNGLGDEIMEKDFKLAASDIKRMVPDLGWAFATDMITVKGKSVDYMYRQEADSEDDSGWRFYGGGETQEYIDDPNNTSLFEVNTIANYDPEIIPFLTYPTGSEIERNSEGKLEVITKNVERPNIIFLQPVDKGIVQIGKNWSFEVSSRMVRRIEDNSLVIWKPGFTIWLNIFTPKNISKTERLDTILKAKSDMSQDLQQEDSENMSKIRYQLNEDGQDSINIFGFTATSQIHMSIYYDNDDCLGEIDMIWNTLSNLED